MNSGVLEIWDLNLLIVMADKYKQINADKK